MSDAPNTSQNERAAKVRRKPERESVLTPTFAAARQTSPHIQNSPSPPHSSLLQRQCDCGKHTIAGSACEECQQKQDSASNFAIDDLSQASSSDIQTTRDSHSSFDFSNIPTRTLTATNGQPIQSALTVNAPDDQYEHEADRVADTVMRMSVSATASSAENDSHLHAIESRLPAISRIQTSGGYGAFQAPASVESRINQMAGTGQPLPVEEQSFFEERMGYDFSGVRIHTDSNAVQASRDIQARAFTVGNNIGFNEGAYRPGTDAGRRLLAHELTHTIQQGNAEQIQQTIPHKIPSNTVPQTSNRSEKNSTSNFLPNSEAGKILRNQRSDRSVLAVPTIQRNGNGEQESSESTQLPQPTRLTVSLSGVSVYVTPEARYQAGPKAPQAFRIVLMALVGSQYTPGLETAILSDYRQNGGSLRGWMYDTAEEGEAMPRGFIIEVIDSPLLFQVIEEQHNLQLNLSNDQRQLIEKGRTVSAAWDALQHAQLRGYIELPLPDWYSRTLFTRRMGQHESLISWYERAVAAAENQQSQSEEDPVLESLRGIVAELRVEAELWEAFRTDDELLNGEHSELMHTMDQEHAMLAGFLGFTATQPIYSERALTEAEARAELLRRYLNAIGRMLGTGDEQLSDSPGRANAQALPAQMQSSPQLMPPLFDAALGTDHTFIMQVQFPDVFEAMAMWYYRWDVVRLPKQQEGEESIDAEELPEGDSPGWSEVYVTRLSRATDYAAADVERVMDELGPPGISALTLVGANNILRYAGTTVSTFFEQVFTPRYEQKVVFPRDGLYMVRCRAGQILEGDEAFVRVPSVTYQLVYARDPNWMAQTRVKLALQSESQARERIAELEQALQENPNQPEWSEELENLRRELGPLGPILTHQRNELTTSIGRLRAQLANESISWRERRNLEQQLSQQENALDRLEEIIGARQSREELHGPGASPERLTASFVSDLGHTIQLSLEAVLRDRTSERHTYYVADSTTPRSQEAEGSGPTREAAILGALQTILEGQDGYGRGRVSVHIDGQIHTRRIEADAGQLLSEAVENISTIVSIAAIAAAPLTGGTSLSILLPVGAIGAIPSAYRLINRAQAGTLHWGLQDWMDVANIAGGVAGVGQALRPVRLGARALMIFGLGADGMGAILLGASIMEQLDALENLPEGERAARTLYLIGQAMVGIGIAAGTAMMRRAVEMRPNIDEPHLRPDAEGSTPRPDLEGGRSQPGTGDTTPRPETGPAPRGPEQPRPGAEIPGEQTITVPLTPDQRQGVRTAVETELPESTVLMPPDRANSSPQEQLRYVQDAQLIYENTRRGMAVEGAAGVRAARLREAALYRNSQTGDFIIIQGGESSVHVGPGASGRPEGPAPSGYAQRWKEILDGRDVGRWDLVSHSHPIDPSTGAVADANRFPSGANGDLGVLLGQSDQIGGQSQRSRINFETPEGPNYTDFGYDPTASNKFWVDYPDPRTGRRHRLEFPDLEAYHDWMRRTHGADQGSIPDNLRSSTQGGNLPASARDADSAGPSRGDSVEGPYVAGQPSQRYQALDTQQRRKINQEVDRRFQAETGVTRRLSPHNPEDMPLIRRWLRIRDSVMAETDRSSAASRAEAEENAPSGERGRSTEDEPLQESEPVREGENRRSNGETSRDGDSGRSALRQLDEVFQNPSVLAGRSPGEVAHLFPNNRWAQSGTSGRSSGVKFSLLDQNGQVSGNIQIRQSGGETSRHFRGPNGEGLPYWHISVGNGNPNKLWIGPDGIMYTRPPVYRSGRIDPDNPAIRFQGSIELPDSIRSLLAD